MHVGVGVYVWGWYNIWIKKELGSDLSIAYAGVSKASRNSKIRFLALICSMQQAHVQYIRFSDCKEWV